MRLSSLSLLVLRILLVMSSNPFINEFTGLSDPEKVKAVGMRFRDTVLSLGGSFSFISRLIALCLSLAYCFRKPDPDGCVSEVQRRASRLRLTPETGRVVGGVIKNIHGFADWDLFVFFVREYCVLQRYLENNKGQHKWKKNSLRKSSSPFSSKEISEFPRDLLSHDLTGRLSPGKTASLQAVQR